MHGPLRFSLAVSLLFVANGCSCGQTSAAIEPLASEPQDGNGGGGGGAGGTTQPSPPTASAGSDGAICVGAARPLGVEPVSGWTYRWTPTDGLSDANSANPNASPTTTTTYTLTVTDTASDLWATDEVTVTVHPLPLAKAGPDARFTLGGSAALSRSATGGEAPYSWRWTSRSGACNSDPCLVGADSATATVSPASSETFALVATDALGCRSLADEVEVTVDPVLVATAGAARGICSGETVAIGADATGGVPPYSYQWTSSPSCAAPGCLSSASVASPNASPTATTAFTQTVTDAVGVQAASTTTVWVDPHPGMAGADQLAVNGAAVVLGPVTSLPAASYSWTCNRAACALSSLSGANPTASPLLSTRYTLNASSGQSCTVTSTQTVWRLLQTASIPSDGEPAWPINSKLIVTFDQPLLATSATASNVRLEDALSGATVATAATLDSTGRRLTVVPTGANYAAGGDYTLVLVGGQSGLRSSDGILPNILATDRTIDLTTAPADTTAPAISARIPGVGATDVSPTTTVIVRFAEAIDPASVSGATVSLSHAAGVATATIAFDGATNTVTLTPATALAYSTSYTVAIAGVADFAGNPASGSWTFTTGVAPDLTPPVVTAVTPANGAVDVTATPLISVTFSEPVLPSTAGAGISLRRVSDGTTVAGSVTLDATSTIARLAPVELLASLEQYEVVISGVTDLSQNAMAAAFTSTFTTRRRLFADNFEGGVSAWSLSGGWGLTTKASASPLRSLTDSPAGKYAANVSSTASLASPIPLSNVGAVSVQLAVRTRTEKNNDVLRVEYQLDGGGWLPVPNAAFSGNVAWATRSFALDTSGVTQLSLRFHFTTNGNKQLDGVFVDDVLVQTP